MKNIINILIAIVFLGISSNSLADSLYYLALKSQVNRDFDRLSLSDILDMTKTSPEIVTRYGAIPVKLSDAAAGLKPSDVLLALSLAGADLSEIQLVSSGDTAIQSNRDSEVLDEIKRAVRVKLVQVKGEAIKDAPLEFYSLPQQLPERKNFVRAEAELLSQDNDGYRMSVNSLGYSGSPVSVADVGVKLSLKKKIVVANRALMPGEFVSSSDFSEVERVVSDSDSDYFQKTSDLGERRWLVAESVEQGSPLRKSAVTFAVNFEKGAVVTLVAGNGSFKVRTKGRVKEVLDNGASVLVQNIDSQKEILGRPMGPGEVKIDY